MSQSAPTDIDIGRFYTPQPVQRKFHASEARYPLLEGGRGGGKSTALLWEAISQCLLVPGANCLLLRRTLTAMEKGGIEDLFKKQVPRSLYRRYNATKHVITFYNGSNLLFGHVKTDADLPQYQGAEFVFIGWEELTQFTYRQWDFLKGSNRCPIKTYWHKGCEYAVRRRMAAFFSPGGRHTKMFHPKTTAALVLIRSSTRDEPQTESQLLPLDQLVERITLGLSPF